MTYTIHKLATLSGVSVRTLHYYDEIQLLLPARREDNGYRLYGEAELLRLQQILFFRELDFPLQDIGRILDSPGFMVEQSLLDHKQLIKLKQKRLNKLLKTIDLTLYSMSNNQPASDDELYDAFKDDDVKQYQAEVKARWGNTDAYKQSQAKVSKMTNREMDELKANADKFNRRLAAAMGKDLADAEVQALVAEHYAGINFFYTCSIDMYKNLAEMYVADPRFSAYYDKYAPGLAVFLRDAIHHFIAQKQ